MTKKIGVVFSGFGSQFVGMAKDVYDDSRIVQEYFEEAYNCLGLNFVKLCFASSDEELSKVTNAYLAIFLADISLYSLLTQLGIKPDLLAGYGIGRYAALFAAGGFSFPDGLYLLNKYSQFYQDFLDHDHNLHLIAVTGLPLRKIQALCQEIAGESGELFIAAVHSNDSQLIVGQNKLVKKLEHELVQLKKQVVIKHLPLAWGVNCSLAKEFVANFKIYLGKVDFKELVVPVLSGITGKQITTNRAVKKELIDQEINPIMWQKVQKGLADCDIIIEVGPGHMLADQLQKKYPDKIVLMLNKKEDIVKIKSLVIADQQDSSYEE